LSEKERAERAADGRCFRCNEHGHLSRNCPRNNSVKHTGNKPPGIPAFGMTLIGEADQSVEVLDSMPVGAISF
ncbi:hypothetical protein CPC08DRAFT_599388, partial [Agrocybe pediades]